MFLTRQGHSVATKVRRDWMDSQARTPSARLGDANIGFGAALPQPFRATSYGSVEDGAAIFTNESWKIFGRVFAANRANGRGWRLDMRASEIAFWSLPASRYTAGQSRSLESGRVSFIVRRHGNESLAVRPAAQLCSHHAALHCLRWRPNPARNTRRRRSRVAIPQSTRRRNGRCCGR